jgi:hypothetical protein
MKEIKTFGLCAVFAVLAALVFSGCPEAEEDPPAASTVIRLTNIPGTVLKDNIFLAVFTNKESIQPGDPANMLKPLSGGVALLVGKKSWWQEKPDTLAFPFSWAGGNGTYVLVLGVSATENENDPQATTYATNGRGGDFSVVGNGAPVAAIPLVFTNGVAELNFSANFMHTGTRTNLLTKLGDGTY